MPTNHPDGLNHYLITPATPFMPMPQPTGDPHRGNLIIGILHPREMGKRGREPKCLLLPTVAIGAKLEYTKRGMVPSLTQKRLIKAVNKVFAHAPVVVNVGERRTPLTLSTLKRRCYSQDKNPINTSPNEETPDVICSYMGFAYEDLDGNDAYQQWIYHRHITADGLFNLITWLIGVVIGELETPGSAELCFANKTFIEREKRAFRIEIVGVKAMEQRVDSDDLNSITTPDAINNTIATTSLFDGMDTGGPIPLILHNHSNSPSIEELGENDAGGDDDGFQTQTPASSIYNNTDAPMDVGQHTGYSSGLNWEFDWE